MKIATLLAVFTASVAVSAAPAFGVTDASVEVARDQVISARDKYLWCGDCSGGKQFSEESSTERAEQKKQVLGSFNYYNGLGTPALDDLTIIEGTSPDNKTYHVPVTDLRSLPAPLSSYTHDKHGFQIVRQPLPISPAPGSVHDHKVMTNEYYPVMTDLLKKTLGARCVTVRKHSLRDIPNWEIIGMNPEVGFEIESLAPFNIAHSDYTPAGARGHFRAMKESDWFSENDTADGCTTPGEREEFLRLRREIIEAEDRAIAEAGIDPEGLGDDKRPTGGHWAWDGSNYDGPRYGFFSIWRAWETVRRDPLAVMDMSQRASEDIDYAPLTRTYRNRPGCVPFYYSQNAMILPSNVRRRDSGFDDGDGDREHAWCYLSEQTPEEVYLIKFFDSEALPSINNAYLKREKPTANMTSKQTSKHEKRKQRQQETLKLQEQLRALLGGDTTPDGTRIEGIEMQLSANLLKIFELCPDVSPVSLWEEGGPLHKIAYSRNAVKSVVARLKQKTTESGLTYSPISSPAETTCDTDMATSEKAAEDTISVASRQEDDSMDTEEQVRIGLAAASLSAPDAGEADTEETSQYYTARREDLSCLESGTRLTGKVIFDALQLSVKLNPLRYIILDPVASASILETPFDYPNHRHQQWVLVKFDRLRNIITVFDLSSISPTVSPEVEAHVRLLATYLVMTDLVPTVRSGACPQQISIDDCGVAVIVNGMRAISTCPTVVLQGSRRCDMKDYTL
ncbi:hypothetical protein CkaCkLH20_11421 [Colletotrichum karsti]|uniref:Uncharacterized protein n=1 Tax=Colletotrichum karsti TaxID=1095194 RepID=A0A9P6LD72_9PEZI|nr:uncharacterized protein CkaCkLH20_11421 [Colletotrichum karsti]KAF9871004.1 hypothetical protein CkaCkLH20_11421 [Colletotrichum karsti]